MISFSEHIKEIEEGVNDPAIFKAIFLAGGFEAVVNHLLSERLDLLL